MALLYENTDGMIRYYTQNFGKKLKLSPDPGPITYFLAGVVTGFFVLPIVLPIVGFQITKRWGLPPPPPPPT